MSEATMIFNTTRECPGGCGQKIPGNWFACETDWARLPSRFQLSIVTTCPHVPRIHAEAVHTALEWYRCNPRDGALIGQPAVSRRG